MEGRSRFGAAFLILGTHHNLIVTLKKAMGKYKKQKIRKAAADAFSNPAARTGFGTMDLMQATDYPMTRLTQNYELLTSLYRDNWIVQNIVQTVPDDVARKWYDIKSAIAPEYIDRLKRLERKTGLRAKITHGMYWGRLYGGAAGLILIRGQDNLEEPLDIGYIAPESFQGLMILDRWTGIYPSGEIVNDPGDPDFGLPEFYTIKDEERGYMVAKVHHSRVIRFVGRELPWLEQVVEQYWGESELEAIFNEVVRRDNVAANIAGLTFRANLSYMETDGLDQLLGTGNAEMQRRFWNTMQAQSIMESNFGMRVINHGDAIHHQQYTFTGLPDVYDRIMMDVAGAARTPVTKLFGRSPAGMNATGEADMINYYDYIDGIRETQFRAILERLLPIMAMSAWGQIPDDLDITFPAMQTPDPAELANITQTRTAAITAAYQAELIDAATAMRELQEISEETGTFTKIKDEDAKAAEGKTYSSTKAMQDPMSGLFSLPDERNNSEETVKDAEPYEEDYNPSQARDPDGRFSSGTGGAKWDFRGNQEAINKIAKGVEKNRTQRNTNKAASLYKALGEQENVINRLIEEVNAGTENGDLRALMSQRRQVRQLRKEVLSQK